VSRKLDIIALMFEIDVRPHPTVKVAVGLSKFVPVFKVILFQASKARNKVCALTFISVLRRPHPIANHAQSRAALLGRCLYEIERFRGNGRRTLAAVPKTIRNRLNQRQHALFTVLSGRASQPTGAATSAREHSGTIVMQVVRRHSPHP
jgi:hypothetical protein